MIKKITITLFFVIILFFITKPLFNTGYFPIHDDIQTMRVYQMEKCIRDGQIPCRWVPDMGYGYGYPQFNYYAPLPYYLMTIPIFLGYSVIESVKIGFLASFIVSAIGMYLLGKKLWGRAGGALSSLLYLYLPYRAVNVYVRGAMGEVWAMSILPFVFLYIYNVVNRGDKKSILGLAMSLAVLLTSHNVTTLIFAPFALTWAAFCYFDKRQNKGNLEVVKKITFGGIWGIGLASFFLLPAWFEKDLVHVDSIIMGYFNYLAHFVGLKQLLFGGFWGYGSSELGPYDDIYLSLGVLWWVLPILALLMFYIFKMKERKTLLLLVISGWFSVFMIHSKSTPIWLSVETLSFVQFPWRFLAISGFLFSLAAGSLMNLVVYNQKLTKNLLFLFSTILIMFYSGFFRHAKIIDIDDEKKFSGNNWIQQQTISIFDYLPVSAEKPPTKPATNIAVEKGRINEIKYNEGSDWKTWELEVLEGSTLVSLPIIYFPNWKVFDNGRERDFVVTDKSGVIKLNLDSGKHLLEAKLYDTPIRKTGNLLSLMALFLIPVYLYSKRHKRNI